MSNLLLIKYLIKYLINHSILMEMMKKWEVFCGLDLSPISQEGKLLFVLLPILFIVLSLANH